MTREKHPPPDHPGNLAGRALLLVTRALQQAQADARAGADFTKARSLRMSEIEAALRAIEQRRDRLSEVEASGQGDFLARMASLEEL